MRSALSILVLAAACGDSGPTHWNKQPLETFEATHEGTAFTIQLPKGMQKSKVESKYSVEWAYHANVGGEDYVFAPSVSVGKVSKKETLDEAIKDEKDIKSPTDVLFKEETANGWVFAMKNSYAKKDEDFIVRGQTFVGDGALTCSARLYPMKKDGTAKDDIPRVAKMCQSIQPK